MQSYKIAKKNLRSHYTRTLLTVLGVAIGVFIISLVLIISGGLKESILNQVSELKKGTIVVRNGGSLQTGMSAFSPINITPISTLSDNDIKNIAENPEVKAISPMIFTAGEIIGSENTYKSASVIATNNDFSDVFELEFVSGGWFDEGSLKSNEVVLGYNLAVGLFGTDQAVGQILTIKKQNFTVVGVIKKINQPISLAGTDIDKTAFISLKQKSVIGVKSSEIGQIVLKTNNSDPIKISEEIEHNLSLIHKDESEFSVLSGNETSEILSGWLLTLTSVALIFASISLIVGGIGIMNIMFVSVTERIREIGIRKSVGATRRNIFMQFLSESILMTVYGSILGITFAYLIGFIISLNFSLPLVFDPYVIIIGLGVPIIVGIVFGTWPAVRAARQDPIKALKNLN